MKRGRPVDCGVKVLEFSDDEATEYVILSHWWVMQEVDYNEMVELVKMDKAEIREIRQQEGYQKILQSCEQAQKDGYKWLWVNTCCIDR